MGLSGTQRYSACHVPAAWAILEAYAGGILPDFGELERTVVAMVVRSDDTVIPEGQPHRFVYFVVSGLLKTVARIDDGPARLVSFTEPHMFVASLSGIGLSGVQNLAGKGFDPRGFDLSDAAAGRARSHTVAVQTSELLQISVDTLQELALRSNRWSSLLVTMLAAHAIHLQAESYSMRCETPEARYRRLLNERPRLASSITQKDLAAFLGVSVVGFAPSSAASSRDRRMSER